MVGTSFLYFPPHFSRQNLLVNLDFAYLARLASQRAACLTPWPPALGLQMCVTVPSFYVGLGDSNSVSYPPHIPHSALLTHAVLALHTDSLHLSQENLNLLRLQPLSPQQLCSPQRSHYTPLGLFPGLLHGPPRIPPEPSDSAMGRHSLPQVGDPMAPSPFPTAFFPAPSLPSLSSSQCRFRLHMPSGDSRWPGGWWEGRWPLALSTHDALCRVMLRYPECFLLRGGGGQEKRGHESHLPRRQKKARAMGGFILGAEGRGHGSLLDWKEMSRAL